MRHIMRKGRVYSITEENYVKLLMNIAREKDVNLTVSGNILGDIENFDYMCKEVAVELLRTYSRQGFVYTGAPYK